MNRDDIIDLADKAGFEICRGDGWPDKRLIQKLMRFTALVAAAERESCAQLCEIQDPYVYSERTANACAAAIRQRGNQ